MEWMTIDGFDEDRHREEDAARPQLTADDLADLAEWDEWIAKLAANQPPLDGCEADADKWIEDYAAKMAA